MDNDLKQWLASRSLTMDAVTDLHTPAQLPVKEGVYWVEFGTNGRGNIGPRTAAGWCWWNGTFWGITVSRPWMARDFSVTPGMFQGKYWRGLCNEAKG